MVLAKVMADNILSMAGYFRKVCYDDCRICYNPREGSSKDNERANQTFIDVCNYVDSHVFGQSKIVTMDV